MIDHLRSSGAGKRGGNEPPITLPTSLAGDGEDPDLLDLDRALENLGAVDSRLRELVELKYFLGLTHGEIAELHECSAKTVQRDWRRARALLYSLLSP